MKKINVLLCGLALACVLTGCGEEMPELTQEENDIITEYAVGLLLKYDKHNSGRLVDLADYEEEPEAEAAEEPGETKEDEPEPEETAKEAAEVVDVSEEGEVFSSIEDFYGIEGFSFQYTGCDLYDEYPEMAENEADAFFAMQATGGMQLLVLKFQVTNISGAERELNMLDYGMRSRISVNGGDYTSVLSTLLLNDIQAYKGTIAAGDSIELAGIVEVPQGIYVESLSMQLRGDSGNAVLTLQ